MEDWEVMKIRCEGGSVEKLRLGQREWEPMMFNDVFNHVAYAYRVAIEPKTYVINTWLADRGRVETILKGSEEDKIFEESPYFTRIDPKDIIFNGLTETIKEESNE